MASYTAAARSNYFRVKNPKAFRRWCDRLNLDILMPDDAGPEPFFAITPSSDTGSWPSFHPDTDEEIDIHQELAPHLDPRDVAILMQSGHEKLRFITGFATAVHADGRCITISLRDIYDRAREEFGQDLSITEAIY